MLQRLQTVWLLLVAGFNGLTFKLPFYTGDWLRDTLPNSLVNLNAQLTPWFTALTVVTAALALITIFLYKDRKLQLKLCYLGIFLSAVLLTLYFLEMSHFQGGTVAIWAVFYLGIIGSFILATRGILKDEKLIKSMDRLR